MKFPAFSHPLVLINLSIIFMSTSGVLGRYIQLDSTMTTWWRCAIAAIALWLICKLAKIDLRIKSKADRKKLVLAGILLSIHFPTYFYSLDYSNVAIALLTLYTFPAFTAIIEPIFTKSPFKLTDLILACISLIGVMIMIPSFSLKNEFSLAIILGLISSITYVFRNLILLEPAKQYSGSALMFYQLVVLSLVLTPFWFFIDGNPSNSDWPAIVALALVTTVLGHTLFVMSLKKLNATTASLLSCLAPVLAILWAYLFLNEVPTNKTLLGGAIILATVVSKTILKAREK